MRQCFLHIGTHKTGTTSLQWALSGRHRELRDRHYLYPLTGRATIAPHGHHNIAWEISGDRRFDPANGRIEDLITEIATASHDVILSSEDFECSVSHGEAFGAFIRRLQSRRLRVRLVVYLRNQVDYARSLYLTMLDVGSAVPFTEFLSQVLECRQFHWGDWTFPFCYRDLLTRLEAIGEVDVVVRSFDRAQEQGFMRDALSVFGLDPHDLGIDENIHANMQKNMLDAAKMFYGNCMGAPIERAEADAIAFLFQALNGRAPDMSSRSKREMVEQFGESNDYVVRKYGIPSFERMKELETHLGSDDEAPLMECVFSRRLVELVADMGNRLRVNANATAAQRDEYVRGCLAVAREQFLGALPAQAAAPF